MNHATIPFDLRAVVHRIVPEVFETMLAQSAIPVESSPAAPTERVSATIGLAGEHVAGAVYVHFPEALARAAAAGLLQITLDRPASNSEVNDATGELCNMIAGGLKSALCDAGVDCAISAPSIIRGPAFTIEAPPGSPVSHFCFACGAHALTLEVHLQLEPLPSYAN